jgi:ABC-type uncharacterized transport system substrate-binding protein
VVAFFMACPAAAHPHVWATVWSEILFGPDHKIIGIRHTWTFDEFYSAMAVQGLDTNGDGVFSKKELEPLAKVNVDSLKDFDYFTFVHIGENGDNLPLKPPEDYSLDYNKGLLTLHFTCHSRLRSTRRKKTCSSTSTTPPSSSPSASPRTIQ